MTRTNRTTTTRLRRTAGVAVAAATAALTLLVPSPAEASTRVASPEVAAVAADALDALARLQTTGSRADYTHFAELRSQAASLTASGVGVPAAALRDSWAGVSLQKQHVILAAISQLGVPYRSMKSEPGKGFDCSGLMLYAFHQAGVELPRSSRDQIRDATEVGGLAVQPGDLVYYPGHISMYVGVGLVVHSPFTGSEVEVRPIFDRSLRFGDVFDGSVELVEAAGSPVRPPVGH